ncbi:MAG TPA: chorismate mutase, partial [Phycisphaerae bacterium]|nr:chorismate mutase [Phycisphaerae bacterium]
MTAELDSLRAALDRLDDGIVAALAERQRLVDSVAGEKLRQPGGLQDPRREQEIMARLSRQATAGGLDERFVTRLFREILSHSVRRQQEHLLDAQAYGWVRRHEFFGETWSMTERGRAESERQLAAELDAVGGRAAVAEAHRLFLSLNGPHGVACTNWQVRP